MLEGLMQIMPRKGVIVQSISLDEVLQILEARLINEVYCIELATERATNQQLSAMQALLASADVLTRAWDREKLMNLDREFHRMISQAACNSVIDDILRALHKRSLRVWFIAVGDDLQLRRIAEEHRAIIEAIKGRNRRQAAAAMRSHIESSRDHIVRAI
jgi:GntR family transcriptional regulator, rspAB operon transcriptional repressor